MSKNINWTPEQVKQADKRINKPGDLSLATGYAMAVDACAKEQSDQINNVLVEHKDEVVRYALPIHDINLLKELLDVSKYYGQNISAESTIAKIKPLSVNECWQGRRYKTPAYKNYCLALSLLLPDKIIVPDGLLHAYYEFGISSMAGDWDNPCKPAQDIISKKYKFNDKRIRKATVELRQVPKGEEYIKFSFEPLNK